MHFATFMFAAVAPTINLVPQSEVEGADIPCNGKPLCKLCQKEDDMTTNKAKVRPVRIHGTQQEANAIASKIVTQF